MMVAVAPSPPPCRAAGCARAPVIGALGGFATPLIVSPARTTTSRSFAYYFVLDLGIAAVAWSKDLAALNVIGFAATFIVATAWRC